MVLLIAGLVLMALGLFSGGVLVLAPLGWVALKPDVVLWVMFPVMVLLGYALVVMASKTAQALQWSFGVSAALLALALVSAVALVLSAASVLHPEGNLLSLWYVLAFAGVVGLAGTAARQTQRDVSV